MNMETRTFLVGEKVSMRKRFSYQRQASSAVAVLLTKSDRDPLLASNMATARSLSWYEKRFRIETFFSDQKSRGFHIHKSHISDVHACHGY